jgi:hypothetical protein
MAYSTDTDLQDIIPDILDFGIAAFTDEHGFAEDDINRELRSKWFYKLGISGEMDATLLTASQFTKASSYLVLWKYALPQLTNWVDNDRFLNMIDFYKQRYNEEMASIFADGVEYDRDDDGSLTQEEKKPVANGRLVR